VRASITVAPLRGREAQLFTLPSSPPPVVVAGVVDRERTARRPARRRLLRRRHVRPATSRPSKARAEPGSLGSPRSTCWATTEEQAWETAVRWWPSAALRGAALTELAHPRDFGQVLGLASPDDIVENVALGPEPERHLDLVASFA